MPDRFVIRGGRVIDPANGIDRVVDVVVADGKIVSVGAPNAEAPAGPAIDVRRLIVCPGLIDMHVHLREPGGEHKETIETGTRAAAAGGFTAVACMPNTTPAIDEPRWVEYVRARAEEVGACRVYPMAAITRGRRGRELVDMATLRGAGAVAFTDDGEGVEDDVIMREALRQAREIDVPVVQHCEFKRMSAGGVMHRGAVAERLGLPGIDPRAEEAMIARDIGLVRQTGGRYHVAHISTGRAVELVRKAKAEGLPVTAEVCTHHLLLTDEACEAGDPNTKMHPPLRGAADVEACREGLTDGTIDCLVTDHAPHTAEEKAKGFLEAPFGIVGLETALALNVRAMVTAGASACPASLVKTGLLSWSELIRRMSTAPAAILGVAGGSLSPGASADVTVIDPDLCWRIDPESFLSKSRNTPFAGWEVTGRAVLTLLAGGVTHRDAPFGERLIPR